MDTLYFSLIAPHDYFIVSHEAKKVPSPLLKSGSLSDLSELHNLSDSFQRLTAIIPGEMVSLYELHLPIRSRKQALQALPYALEDQLAAPINDVEFILLDWKSNAVSTVAVIAKNLWQSFLQDLETHHIFVDELVPDFSVLPLEQDAAALIFKQSNDGRLLIRQRKGEIETGLVLGEDELPFWLDEFDAQGLKLICNDESIFTQLSQENNLNATIEYNDKLNSGDLSVCVTHAEFSDRGKFLLYSENQSKKTVEKVKPWLIASAILVVLSLLCFTGANTYQGYLLAQHNQKLDEKIAEVFQNNFPQVQRIVDAKLQFQRELDELKGNAKGSQEFLHLLNEVVVALPRNTIKVRELHYRESALDVVLTMENFQILDGFADNLTQKNTLKFKLLSSDSQGGRVVAKYRFSVPSLGGSNE